MIQIQKRAKKKTKYRGMFETQKSGNKTSSGELHFCMQRWVHHFKSDLINNIYNMDISGAELLIIET